VNEEEKTAAEETAEEETAEESVEETEKETEEETEEEEEKEEAADLLERAAVRGRPRGLLALALAATARREDLYGLRRRATRVKRARPPARHAHARAPLTDTLQICTSL
jgi:hypothetical protein